METWRLKICVVVLILFTGVIACGDDNTATPDNDNNGNTTDTTPPSAVTNLRTESPTTNSIALVWTSPGDDGDSGTAAAYDVRYSASEITEQNWDTANQVAGEPGPKPCGAIETIRVTDLESGSTYHFALKVSDEIPNLSGLSNCVCDSTVQEKNAPAAISDLFAVALDWTVFQLTWTAPGDDGNVGTAYAYDIRYSTSRITEENWESATPVDTSLPPGAAGSPDSLVVSGLTARTNYFFAIKAADEVPNWSGISNETPALAHGNRLWLFPDRVTQGKNVTIVYRRAHSGTTALHAHYRDQTDQWVMIEADGPWPPGIYTTQWDFRNFRDEYHSSPYGLYTFKLYWNMNLKTEATAWLDR